MSTSKITCNVTKEERELIQSVCRDRGRSMVRQIMQLFREEAVRIEREKQLGLRGIKL